MITREDPQTWKPVTLEPGSDEVIGQVVEFDGITGQAVIRITNAHVAQQLRNLDGYSFSGSTPKVELCKEVSTGAPLWPCMLGKGHHTPDHIYADGKVVFRWANGPDGYVPEECEDPLTHPGGYQSLDDEDEL